MIFARHLDIVGQHAFLGASKWNWINYSEDKLKQAYLNNLAVQRGTELHEFASDCIRLKQPLPKLKKTLNMYVNDAIKFSMNPEQPLFYSKNFYGTADAIAFDDDRQFLRIHDLKTGHIKAHIEQLEIYAALFCLEYHHKPNDLAMELRIYQGDEIMMEIPDSEQIARIMKTAVIFDDVIEQMKMEE